MFGPSIALACALSWSIAVIFFRKAGNVSASALNVFKNFLGLILFIPTILIFYGNLHVHMSAADFWLLAFSGVIGIGISDGLYLWSLNLIGASRLAIIDCVYAPTIMILAWVFLHESLAPVQIGGILLVIAAVFLIASEGSTSEVPKKDLIRGSIVCAIAIIAMASGILLIKPVFARVDLLWIILVRMGAGFLSAAAMAVARSNRRAVFDSIWNSKNKMHILLASFFGTYLSMVFWVAGFKYNKAAIAAILNQTTTFFTVIFAAVILKESITQRKIVATFLAFLGVVLVTIG